MNLSVPRIATVVFAMVSSSVALAATPGALDPAYGTQQGFTPYWVHGKTYGSDMLAQPDGGWIVSGTIEQNVGKAYELVPYLVRYRADGTVDESFGDRGRVSPPLKFAVAYPSGNVAGDAQRLYLIVFEFDQIYVAAYFHDGRPDLSYGKNGISKIAIGAGFSLSVDAVVQDGKLLIAGSGRPESGQPSPDIRQFLLMRLDTNGKLDPTFGTDGKSYTYRSNNGVPYKRNTFWSIALTADGKILAAGSYGNVKADTHSTVARFSPDGALDNSFGESGFRKIGFLDYEYISAELTVQADGRIVTAVTTCALASGSGSDPCFAGIARLLSDGQFDNSFGNGGKAVQFGPGEDTSNSVSGMAVDAQGRVVIGGLVHEGSEGERSSVYLLRLKANGALDAAFGNNGMVHAPYPDAPYSGMWSLALAPVSIGGGQATRLFTIGYRSNAEFYSPTPAATADSVISRHFYDDVPAAVQK